MLEDLRLRLPRHVLELPNHSLELASKRPRLQSCESVGQRAVVPEGRVLRGVKPFSYPLTYGAVVS